MVLGWCGRYGLVYKGCGQTDRQTDKYAFTKIETQFYRELHIHVTRSTGDS